MSDLGTIIADAREEVPKKRRRMLGTRAFYEYLRTHPPRALRTIGEPGEKYRSLGSRQRQAIYDRNGRICGVCGRTDGRFEIDHKFPFAMGGTHDPANLWVLCRPCNQAKGCKTVEEFLKCPKVKA